MHVRTSSPFIQPKRSLVTWLITLLLIICPSSYKARPDNLIGPNSFCSGIVSPQRSNARPNFPTSNVVGGAKFVWHPGYLWAVLSALTGVGSCSILLSHWLCLLPCTWRSTLKWSTLKSSVLTSVVHSLADKCCLKWSTYVNHLAEVTDANLLATPANLRRKWRMQICSWHSRN